MKVPKYVIKNSKFENCSSNKGGAIVAENIEYIELNNN